MTAPSYFTTIYEAPSMKCWLITLVAANSPFAYKMPYLGSDDDVTAYLNEQIDSGNYARVFATPVE